MTTVSVSESPKSTLELGTASSFQEWTRLVGHRFVPLDLSTNRLGSFRGSLRSQYVEETCITEIVADSHRVQRLSSAISSNDPTHLKLSLQLEGTGIVAQDGREAVLQPGDVAIYDTSRPYTLEFEGDMRSLVMMFPHHMLGLSAGLIHKLTAVRLPGDSGIGRVICPFMQHLAENLDQLTGINGVRIIRSAFDLLTAMLSAELLDNHAADEPWLLTVQKVRAYIDAHLDNPELNVAEIAQAHYLSLRYLQYLFQQEGQTVSGFIRERRLERCRMDLIDPALHPLSILQIAQRWGFVDASHFSKAFKSSYAISPKDFRAHCSILAAEAV